MDLLRLDNVGRRFESGSRRYRRDSSVGRTFRLLPCLHSALGEWFSHRTVYAVYTGSNPVCTANKLTIKIQTMSKLNLTLKGRTVFDTLT